MAWTELTDSSFDPGQPITQNQGLGLKNNFEAVAQRLANAPIVQTSAFDVYTSGSGATWTIPDDVTAFTVICLGGGGSDENAAVNGGDSTFAYDGTTITGQGGDNGNAGGLGGPATNGDINIIGGTPARGVQTGEQAIGGCSIFGGGSEPTRRTYGAGQNGLSGTEAGGAGGCAIKRFTVNAVAADPTYTVGAGGGNAGDGIIIILY